MGADKLRFNMELSGMRSVTVTYNRDLVLKGAKEEGQKSLGGFSVDDAIISAFKHGADLAARAVELAVIEEGEY